MFLPCPSYSRSRRTATVMQSVPDRASDCCIVSNVSYLPVPTISRLDSVCEPMRKGASVRASGGEAASGGETVDIKLIVSRRGQPVTRRLREKRFPADRHRPLEDQHAARGE